MSRDNMTVVDPQKVRAIAEGLGLQIKDKKGEFKIHGPDGIKRSIAVPNTKGGATRIYLVGFTSDEGTKPFPKPPAKTVTQMFDHALEEKLLLKAIKHAARLLVHATSVEPATKEPEATEPEREAAAG